MNTTRFYMFECLHLRMGVGDETGDKWNEPFQSNAGNSKQRRFVRCGGLLAVALELSAMRLTDASAFLFWSG